MRQLGYIIGGELVGADGAILAASPNRAVTVAEHTADQGPVTVAKTAPPPTEPSKDPITEIASLLARVTRLTQSITSDGDRRRARELVHATSSLLAASTVLKRSDQELFQDALREA